MPMHYFTDDSIACGLQPGEFAGLSADTKRRLVVVMSRLAEKSYRRGFDQGDRAVAIGTDLLISPVELRHEWPLSKSPLTHEPGGYTAIERLFIENPELTALGFASK